MSFTNLPTELLDIIVEFSLPEGFENLATTCKRIYTRCLPFLKRHNELRSRFCKFSYWAQPKDSLVAAADLICLIATDPIVARYIRKADLGEDCRYIRYFRAFPEKSVPSIEEGGPIVQLFAESTHLRRAGLDWKEYYSVFAEDIRNVRYSQHASAFLLTLLPNVEDLTMPPSWKPSAAMKKLLDVVANDARQSSSWSSSLQSVKSLHGRLSRSETEEWGLSWACPFLALPQLKSFSSPTSFAVGQTPQSFAFGGSLHMADSLRIAYLGGCCIDDVGITDFLKHAPNLRAMHYSHNTERDYHPADWDMCKFMNAISREAGSHLVELSVTIQVLRGSILPGKASTRFRTLKKFEFPLELVMCNINATGITGNISSSLQRFFNGAADPFLRDLIPSSVTHLCLLRFDETSPHEKALDALFRNFRAIRRTQLRNLKELRIACKQEASTVYKQQCNRMVAEGKKEEVDVYLKAYDYSGGIEWDKDI